MSTLAQSGSTQAPPRHEIIKIPDVGESGRDELKQQCFDVRIAVFTQEQGFPLEIEIDDKMSTLAQSGSTQVPPRHKIIKIPDVGESGRDELKQQCFDVRIAVFTQEQGFPLEIEIDEADESATHFLLRLVPSLKPIGTIRATRVDDASYKMGRLAVLKDYRKYRFGRALILTFHDWAIGDARRRGAESGSFIRLNSPYGSCMTADSSSFPCRYGYEPEGDEFDEDGAPHQKMVASLQIPFDPDS
ncbi:acyl-CoA N-acyltransferase [Sanghuangporus baumii]|uniref:Acyl-CoA N-acyltransferase n=1 Tax=Sanghuangporus baumii TaxID=108892 RepID=A0A9Q5I122_SANBA|nr:acyl-CoA N-acyltransferase [Sanghuangporus baumii]